VYDPGPRELAIESHLTEEADDRALVFVLCLLDHAAGDQLVEHLPDRLWTIGLEDRLDRLPDRPNFSPGSTFALYRACSIKPIGRLHAPHIGHGRHAAPSSRSSADREATHRPPFFCTHLSAPVVRRWCVCRALRLIACPISSAPHKRSPWM